jgi:hypothetical protein
MREEAVMKKRYTLKNSSATEVKLGCWQASEICHRAVFACAMLPRQGKKI